jgi:hypothetical protein
MVMVMVMVMVMMMMMLMMMMMMMQWDANSTKANWFAKSCLLKGSPCLRPVARAGRYWSTSFPTSSGTFSLVR